MKHYWKYLKYVMRHKYFVFKSGLKYGVPIWNLIWHDYDKFGWKMFKAYANYFNNFKNLMTEERAEHMKYIIPDYPWHKVYTQEKCELAFNQTWNRHQKINRHHWQAHVRKDDDGTEQVMEMDEVDWREMCADWEGASMARPDPLPLAVWYAQTKGNRQLHPNTQRNIEALLGIEDSP